MTQATTDEASPSLAPNPTPAWTPTSVPVELMVVGEIIICEYRLIEWTNEKEIETERNERRKGVQSGKHFLSLKYPGRMLMWERVIGTHLPERHRPPFFFDLSNEDRTNSCYKDPLLLDILERFLLPPLYRFLFDCFVRYSKQEAPPTACLAMNCVRILLVGRLPFLHSTRIYDVLMSFVGVFKVYQRDMYILFDALMALTPPTVGHGRVPTRRPQIS